MPESQNNVDLDRLRQLALDRCHGALTEEDANELSELLAGSAVAREEYWQIITVYSQLEWDLGGQRDGDPSVYDPVMVEPALRRSMAPHSTGVWWLAIAASLMLGLFGGSLAWWQSDEPTAGQALAVTAPIIGEITPLVKQCSWSFGRPGGNNAGAFRQGDTMRLDEGAVQVRLENDTVALLESPAIMQLVSLDRVRMIQGGVKVKVADGAEGFSVETDTAEVIDLGTVFSVNFEDGNTDLVVYDGEVDLKVASSEGVQSGGTSESHPKRFRAGEAVQVAHDGTLSRIVNVKQSKLHNHIDDLMREPVITAVKDNNLRDDFYSFYEIVPGGMQEDAKAFVDRPHEWNGVHAEGMPAYLCEGDYVKTFNDDKVTELNIEISLTRPATLYVLLDKRVRPPQWLNESFINTGDEVGVDEVHYDPAQPMQYTEGDLSVGAGRSINRTHSIWKKTMPHGGVVSLGANGELIEDAPEGVMSKANMFGVVAVPQMDDAQ